MGRLANLHNDVVLIGDSLEGLGFEVVIAGDAGLGELARAVNAYARLTEGAIGFFYFRPWRI